MEVMRISGFLLPQCFTRLLDRRSCVDSIESELELSSSTYVES